MIEHEPAKVKEDVDGKLATARLALLAISQRMNFGTMTAEMQYAKTWADEALKETE